ncbi:MAG: hypothetical protein ABJN34_03590 [Litoreibacter sp.]|uniref:hypothetical protein n=1 Tax=Litoreibacter sp. TaxID=1969459 RepID=UPI0032980FB7
MKNPHINADQTQPPKPSFRLSFDPNGPADAHARPKIDYLTENEVMKLVAGAKPPFGALAVAAGGFPEPGIGEQA